MFLAMFLFSPPDRSAEDGGKSGLTPQPQPFRINLLDTLGAKQCHPSRSIFGFKKYSVGGEL
jgi:hypothetical protein